MFLFYKLPDIVKRRIIGYAVNGSFGLKERQTVLSTCHEWRELAIPIVFRVVLFRYQVSDAYIDFPPSFAPFTSEILLGSGHPMLPVPSSLYTISIGAISHVKVFLIDLGTPQRCIETLTALPDLLGLSEYLWSSVSSLYFLESKSTIPLERIGLGYRARLKPRLFKTHDIPNILADGIPNVKYLTFNITSMFGACCSFANGLFDKYSRRLSIVDSSIPLIYPSTQIGLEITDLRLRYNSTVKGLLYALDTDRLRNLVITDARSDFSWSDFSKSADNVVCFSAMTCLELSFSSLIAASGSGIVSSQIIAVSFPKLQSLTLRYLKVATSLFNHAQFSNNLKAISAYESLVGLSQLCSLVNVHNLDDIIIVVEDNVDESIFYGTTNLFFNRKDRYGCSSLHVGNLQFPIAPEFTRWRVLDMAHVNRIHYVSLIALIAQSSTLNSIGAVYVSLEAIAPNGDEFDPLGYVQNVPASCISSSLDSLTIQRIEPNMPSTIRTECFKHLTKRLPALKYFYAHGCDIEI